jgi:hypothetical protein
MPCLEDFRELFLQASIFTPNLDFQIGRALPLFLSEWPAQFHRVLFASDLAAEVPGELARLIVQSDDSHFRVSAGPGRVDIVWEGQQEGDRLDLSLHLDWCSEVFGRYLDEFNASPRRLGCVLRSATSDSNPAANLPRYFCKDRWLEKGAPMERIADFALEVAKKYTLNNMFEVDSCFKAGQRYLSDVRLARIRTPIQA